MAEKIVYNIINKFPDRIREAWKTKVIKIEKKPKKIIFVGMGGCYIAGLVLKEMLRDELKIPMEVCPGYSGRINSLKRDTLIILVSYSGNTKEVLNFYNTLLSKKIKGNIVIVTSGGELLFLAKENKTHLIEIKSDLHQRFTFPYVFFPLLKLFDISFLEERKENIVIDIIKVLNKNKKNIEIDARDLSKKFRFRNPLIYGTNYFYPACYRMQTSLEEDAKIIAHSNRITELFHNELEAFPVSRFYPIIILDKEESLEFVKQIAFFRQKMNNYFEFEFYHYHREERMFLFIYFADFLGYYLSKIKGTKMGETPISDEIKKQ
ncbi:MAG: SIS domain-containing protein [Candidatus Pacearchaeota archaeon]